MLMCHMFSEDVQATHKMADTIGINRKWFQNRVRFPHYDICKSKRELAIQHGAIPITRRQLVSLIEKFSIGAWKTVAPGVRE